jgi:DNA polymerase-3 subunit beta
MFTLPKSSFQQKLSLASRFCLTKISSIPSLQGGMLKILKDKLEIITTNLNEFFYTTIKISTNEEKAIVVDVKKIVEFLSFLPSEKISLDINETRLLIENDKTRASFSLIPSADFPPLPKIEGKESQLSKNFIKEKLPLILFAAAKDETRPVLTGINFLTKGGQRQIVATDGFRLSLISQENEKNSFPSVIISASVLLELLRLVGEDREIKILFSDEKKIIKLTVDDIDIYTRPIEGEFPPFEKVIPSEYKTRIVLNREEFLRSIKMTAVFARDYSNIIVFEVKKDGIYLRPRIKEEKETVIFQEGDFEGEPQKIAFNYKFVLDFLINTKGDEVILEITQPNAPAVFKIQDQKDFLHVIMPIRMEEEV